MTLKEYYDFIYDEEELKWFFDHVLIKPKMAQSYALTLAARNKRLSEEEREIYNLNKGQMIDTKIIKARGRDLDWNYDLFYSQLAKFETNKRGLLCKSGLPYPSKCLVLYICMKLADENDCIQQAIHKYQDIQQDILNKIRKAGSMDFSEEIYKTTSFNQNHLRLHANCISEKPYIDFDLDFNDPPSSYSYKDISSKLYPAYKDKLYKWFGKGNFFMITTASGFHVLVKKEVLKFNPKDFIDDVIKDPYISGNNSFNMPYVKELIKNDNLFIPIPGTLQYENHKVRIINKDDF